MFLLQNCDQTFILKHDEQKFAWFHLFLVVGVYSFIILIFVHCRHLSTAVETVVITRHVNQLWVQHTCCATHTSYDCLCVVCVLVQGQNF